MDLNIGAEKTFPAIEILQTTIVDKTNERIDGIVGNNFSSYVRDYDFSVLLLEHNKTSPISPFRRSLVSCTAISSAILLIRRNTVRISKAPVICLSVSSKDTYRRTGNQHPVLGIEYTPDGESLTEQYFAKMGLKVRYFMPENSVAPFAFFFTGDLLSDYTNLELIATISTMETFQKIYRPEIYNANSAAGHCYRPDLNQQDHH